MTRLILTLSTLLVWNARAALPDEPKRLWRFEAEGVARAAPVGDGRAIFFATDRGAVYALDESGSRVWKTSFSSKDGKGTRFIKPLVVSDGVVFVDAGGGVVHALSAVKGEPITRTLPERAGPPAERGSKRVVGNRTVDAEGDALFIRSLDGNALIWSKKMSAEITTFAVVDDVIVVCAADGWISAWGAPRAARDSNVEES